MTKIRLSYRQQGGPAWSGEAPSMLHDFHLPEDGITELDRFLFRAAGREPTSPRPHIRGADDTPTEERD